MASFQEKIASDRMLGDIFDDAFDSLYDDSTDEEREANDIWIDGPPVDIITFINDSQFLNLKGRIYPIIQRSLIEIEDPEIREAIMLLGKGSGKTTSLQIYMLYGVYVLLKLKDPAKYFGLLPNSPIVALLVTVS